MRADGREQGLGRHRPRQSEETPARRGLAGAVLAGGRDLAQGLQAGEAVAPGQPSYVGDDAGLSCLDPAVVGIDRVGGGVGPDGRIVQEENRVVVHREAVRLQAENIVGLLVENGLSRLALTVHRVRRHDPALEVEQVQKRSQGGDLARPGRHAHKAEREARGRREGVHERHG